MPNPQPVLFGIGAGQYAVISLSQVSVIFLCLSFILVSITMKFEVELNLFPNFYRTVKFQTKQKK